MASSARSRPGSGRSFRPAAWLLLLVTLLGGVAAGWHVAQGVGDGGVSLTAPGDPSSTTGHNDDGCGLCAAAHSTGPAPAPLIELAADGRVAVAPPELDVSPGSVLAPLGSHGPRSPPSRS
ncbi:MAG: hypothetical protein JNJ80_22830 [Gemmatimonadetes bacterium]|nr:hypothetical protein [Gemmatimonadota bacterium]